MLGIKRKVISPTFVFMRSYPFLHHKKPLTFYHIDLYRGQDSGDFRNLGLEEIFSEEGIVVLEWAEKIKEVLPKRRIDVIINVAEKKPRRTSSKTENNMQDQLPEDQIKEAVRILKKGGIV